MMKLFTRVSRTLKRMLHFLVENFYWHSDWVGRTFSVELQCAQIGISIQDSWPQELLKFFCYPKFSIALHTVNFIEWTHYRTYCWTSQRLMSGHRCTPPRPRRISVAQRKPLNRAGWKRMEAHSLTLSIIYLRPMTVCLSLIITMLITLIPLLCLLIAG